MPSSQSSVIAHPDHAVTIRLGFSPAQDPAANASTERASSGDEAMFKLSRRLWSLEIHRRLHLQARRMI